MAAKPTSAIQTGRYADGYEITGLDQTASCLKSVLVILRLSAEMVPLRGVTHAHGQSVCQRERRAGSGYVPCAFCLPITRRQLR